MPPIPKKPRLNAMHTATRTLRASSKVDYSLSTDEECKGSDEDFDPEVATEEESDDDLDNDNPEEDEEKDGFGLDEPNVQELAALQICEANDGDLDDEVRRNDQNITAAFRFIGQPLNDQAVGHDEDVGESSARNYAMPASSVTEGVALYDGNAAPPEFYRGNIVNLDVESFKRKEYSKSTVGLMKTNTNQWRKFCKTILQKDDWKDCFYNINFQIIYNFLFWYLNQKRGKDGRMKRSVQKRSSLVTFWCCFRLNYEWNTTLKIDDAIPRGVMHNALIDLGNRFQLSHEKRLNRSLTLDDLKAHVEMILCTTSKDFKLGESRILAVLFLLLMAPQGSRPQSILNIKFRHVKIHLIRDPNDETGPARLCITLRLEETKRYRGPKAVKTFLVPEIMYDPSLLLSPHVFLLAILFRWRAFQSEDLNNNPNLISQLKIHPAARQLPLKLKEDLDDIPLFRQATRTVRGWEMSTVAITTDITQKWLQSIGRMLGFETNTTAYSLRYFAGNSMDQSIDVSHSLRDLVLDHAPNSDTFAKHYLNRFVCADLWAVHRSLVPQQDLIKQATSHGGSRDSRRDFRLTDQHIEELKTHPDLVRDRKNLMKRLQSAKLKEVMEQWTTDQALDDIRRQAQGQDFVDREDVTDARPMTPLQKLVFDTLTTEITNDFGAQSIRRTKAINALVAYCDVEEPLRTKVLEARKPLPPPEVRDSKLGVAEQMQALWRSVFLANGEVLRCFLCVTKAIMLGPNHQNFSDYCRTFYNKQSLKSHFLGTHLRNFADDQQFTCETCEPPMLLLHKQHFQAHAEDVHGVSTEVNYKRKR